MSNCLTTILLLAVAAGTSTTTTHAFTTPLLQRQHLLRPAVGNTALFGGKRRGRLTNNVSVDEDGKVARIMTKKQKQTLGNSKMKKQKGEKATAAISPLLAEWAKEGDDSSTLASSSQSASTSSSVTSTVFVPFDTDDDDNSSSNKNSKRKTNKKDQQRSQRAALSAAQSQQIDALLDQIDDLLQTNNLDRVELVSYISSLAQVGSSSSNNDQVLLPTLKSIVSTKPRKDEQLPSFRLAWAGSDPAICHVGTSLHKVPLARLQEVFLSLGYNRWELFEVIRILGPFPTVRNTLRGDVKLTKLPSSTTKLNREGVRMQISYTSMVDGTGKEILAGKADNIKYVDLDIWFANEKVIVATVPPIEEDGGYEQDPLKGDGSNVLLFVQEENLDEQLEKLRAA
ncbi:hypothetical protein QTG54_007769 [Skeletonema marinoi]|uniref:Plastid lipid-associated protein/fibrillin conserved domain-containing protein n=1 Tax=Skeletonema marinoi TaxID=267567 RepID=A0AAD8Y7M7_9STRA|nr:hypothetical protein QTG54_007769 [Skeletonema marinoi]